jgi:Domain of unknown function (DUF4337)
VKSARCASPRIFRRFAIDGVGASSYTSAAKGGASAARRIDVSAGRGGIVDRPPGESTLELHETQERIEHAEHAHHQERKRAALLIIILAVALALAEMAGKEAQFTALTYNIDVSDLFAFYQAKTIRSTMLRTATEGAELLAADPSGKGDAARKRIDDWNRTIERLDSDPKTGEGRKELLEHAKLLQDDRDREVHAYHDFEFSAAALQLAIVIASAAVITEVSLLEIVSAIFGVAGVCLAVIGWFAPALLRL